MNRLFHSAPIAIPNSGRVCFVFRISDSTTELYQKPDQGRAGRPDRIVSRCTSLIVHPEMNVGSYHIDQIIPGQYGMVQRARFDQGGSKVIVPVG